MSMVWYWHLTHIHDEETLRKVEAEMELPLPSERLTYAGRRRQAETGEADFSVMQAMMAHQG